MKFPNWLAFTLVIGISSAVSYYAGYQNGQTDGNSVTPLQKAVKSRGDIPENTSTTELPQRSLIGEQYSVNILSTDDSEGQGNSEASTATEKHREDNDEALIIHPMTPGTSESREYAMSQTIVDMQYELESAVIQNLDVTCEDDICTINVEIFNAESDLANKLMKIWHEQGLEPVISKFTHVATGTLITITTDNKDPKTISTD